MDSPTHQPLHISSTEAATRYGLTNDHIASLCRRGKIDGTLAGGRLWLVDEASLQAYLAKTKKEKEQRGRSLSKQITTELHRAPASAPAESSLLAAYGSAFALALFIIGALYVSAPALRSTLSAVPWQYLPASVAEVSADWYGKTFIASAVAYLDFIDTVGDLQANSYRTLGAAVMSFAGGAPALPDTATFVSHKPVLPSIHLSQFDISDAAHTAASAFAIGEVHLPRMYPMPVVAFNNGGVLQTLAFLPGEISELLVSGYVGALQWYAKIFVDSVYTFGNTQVYVYEAVAETMNDSSETIGRNVASALLAVGKSPLALARWYQEGSDRVSLRMEPAKNTASIYDSLTSWLAEMLNAPAVSMSPTVPVAPIAPALPGLSPQAPQSAAASSTIIYVVQQPATPAPEVRSVQGVTKTELTTQLQKLSNELKSLIYAQASVPGPTFLGGGFSNALALTQRIDKLDGVTITNSTISGYLSSSAVIGVSQGGTGTTTAPSYGKVLLGNVAGGYDLVATSSLGITGSGSGADTSVANTWSLLQTFSSGILASASSTLSSILNIGGQLNANLSAVIASTTLSGNSLFTNATTTTFAISNITSGSLVKTTTAGSLIAAVAGTDYQTFAWPFTSNTNFGATANSTTTPLWFVGGIQASTTSRFDAGHFRTGISVGSTSPFAYFSIHASSTMATTTLFAIGSTTAAGITSTLFMVSNTGQVSIGTSSVATTTTFVVQGPNTAGAVVAAFTNGSGTCIIDPINTSLSCSSDARLKRNIEALIGSSTLASLLSLRPVFYNWNSDSDGALKHTGFIAQEVQPIFPDLVSSDSVGLLSLNYAGFVPYIISAFKDLVHTIAGFAEKFTTKKLCVADDSGEETCITRAQLDALLADQAAVVSDALPTNKPIVIDPDPSLPASSEPVVNPTEPVLEEPQSQPEPEPTPPVPSSVEGEPTPIATE